MKAYLDILRHILDNGTIREDRTGVGTIGVFGHQARFDLGAGFPLLTTKRIPFRFVVAELLWFLSGDTDASTLQKQGVTIWNEWATEEKCAKFGRAPGDLGPVYGWAWRQFGGQYDRFDGRALAEVAARFSEALLGDDARGAAGFYREFLRMAFGNGSAAGGFDQIAWVEQEIRRNPNSRRLIVSAWNPADAQRVELPPCHTLFQFYVSGGALSCHLYARSIDAFLGLPFNIASYALLTHMMAASTGLTVGELVISFGDLHIYRNHLEQVNEQLSRAPSGLPTLRVLPMASILAIRVEHISLENYYPQSAISAPVAV